MNAPKPPPGSTSERLLEAAGRVFARVGISAATTRELAKEAGVNEVTLFRLFQNKAGLLSAVLERAFLTPADQYPRQSLCDGGTLREMLTHFAETDFERKRRNIALMRVLVGEVQCLGDQHSEILRRIFKPWKDELAARLREAQTRGLMRAGVDPVIIVDQLIAMTFVGALKADTMKSVEYSAETYLAACIDTLLHGIESPGPKVAPGGPKPKKRKT